MIPKFAQISCPPINRQGKLPREIEESGFSKFGALRICSAPTSRAMEPSSISRREFQFLRDLIVHRGVTLSRDEILKEVRNYDGKTFTRTADVHVASLRQKLEEDLKHSRWSLTVLRSGLSVQR